MRRWTGTTTAVVTAMLMMSPPVWAQGTRPCDAQGRVMTPQKVDGQIVKIDAAQNRLTVRQADGTVHEFQASNETLQDLKVGDRIEATLREAPKC